MSPATHGRRRVAARRRTMDLAEAANTSSGAAPGSTAAERFAPARLGSARRPRWRDGGHPRGSPTAAGSATIVRSARPASSSTPPLYVAVRGQRSGPAHERARCAGARRQRQHRPALPDDGDVGSGDRERRQRDARRSDRPGRRSGRRRTRRPRTSGAMSVDVDVVVVGAGPAGSCAATVLARAGHPGALLERGAFPGAKNMYGGVVYPRILDSSTPAGGNRRPVQRWVTRRSTMMLTADAGPLGRPACRPLGRAAVQRCHGAAARVRRLARRARPGRRRHPAVRHHRHRPVAAIGRGG